MSITDRIKRSFKKANEPRMIDFNTVFDFGKNRGLTAHDVLHSVDYNYLDWVRGQDGFRLSERLESELDFKMSNPSNMSRSYPSDRRFEGWEPWKD